MGPVPDLVAAVKSQLPDKMWVGTMNGNITDVNSSCGLQLHLDHQGISLEHLLHKPNRPSKWDVSIPERSHTRQLMTPA